MTTNSSAHERATATAAERPAANAASSSSRPPLAHSAAATFATPVHADAKERYRWRYGGTSEAGWSERYNAIRAGDSAFSADAAAAYAAPIPSGSLSHAPIASQLHSHLGSRRRRSGGFVGASGRPLTPRVCCCCCCWRLSGRSLLLCRLTLDFDTNKKIAEEVAIIPSKRLRNQIAGFVTHLMKRIQRGGSVRGISLKLQVRNGTGDIHRRACHTSRRPSSDVCCCLCVRAVVHARRRRSASAVWTSSPRSLFSMWMWLRSTATLLIS